MTGTSADDAPTSAFLRRFLFLKVELGQRYSAGPDQIKASYRQASERLKARSEKWDRFANKARQDEALD